MPVASVSETLRPFGRGQWVRREWKVVVRPNGDRPGGAEGQGRSRIQGSFPGTDDAAVGALHQHAPARGVVVVLGRHHIRTVSVLELEQQIAGSHRDRLGDHTTGTRNRPRPHFMAVDVRGFTDGDCFTDQTRSAAFQNPCPEDRVVGEGILPARHLDVLSVPEKLGDFQPFHTRHLRQLGDLPAHDRVARHLIKPVHNFPKMRHGIPNDLLVPIEAHVVSRRRRRKIRQSALREELLPGTRRIAGQPVDTHAVTQDIAIHGSGKARGPLAGKHPPRDHCARR